MVRGALYGVSHIHGYIFGGPMIRIRILWFRLGDYLTYKRPSMSLTRAVQVIDYEVNAPVTVIWNEFGV